MVIIKKTIFITIGINLCSYSLLFIIVYLSLLNMGYSFIDYIKYIFSKLECLTLALGIIFIYIGLRKEKKNEVLL